MNYKIIKDKNKNYLFCGDNLTIYELEEHGFVEKFLSEDIHKIKDLLSDFKDANKDFPLNIAKGINEPLNAVILVDTNDCNLRCKYCYAVNFKKSDFTYMDFDTAKQSINFLLNKSPNVDSYGIVFFGGEPLLNFELIKKVVNYSIQEIVEKRKKNVGFSITTNGTIINKEIVNFFKKYRFSITISIDGDKQSHNKFRVYKNGKGSFDKIIKNINILKKNNINFELRATISSDANLFSTLSFFENLGISFGYGLTMNTKDRPENITNFHNNAIDKLTNEFEKIIDFYFEKIKSGDKIFCQNILSSITTLEKRQGKEISCTAGRTAVSINANGDMLPCQNFQDYEELKFDNIKNINSIEYKPIFVAPNVNTINDCNICFAKYLCAGGCFFEKHNDNNDIYKPSKTKCTLTKIQWEYMIKLYSRLLNNNLLSEQLQIKQENFYV